MNRASLIEAMARAMGERNHRLPWEQISSTMKHHYLKDAALVLADIEAMGCVVADAKPAAFMRRWAFDKVDVMAIKKKDRPAGWVFHDVTATKFAKDDVPLFTASTPAIRALKGE
jgi:hypothetical protein